MISKGIQGSCNLKNLDSLVSRSLAIELWRIVENKLRSEVTCIAFIDFYCQLNKMLLNTYLIILQQQVNALLVVYLLF